MSRPRSLPDTPENERRRQTYRESKARAAIRKAERKGKLEAFLDRMMNSGAGSPERRQTMLDILARQTPCT